MKKYNQIPNFVVGHPNEKGMIIFPSFYHKQTRVVELITVPFQIVTILPDTQLLSCLLFNYKSQIP